MTYSGIGRPADSVILQTFYEGVQFTEEEHREQQRASAMKAVGIESHQIDRKERFKRIDARFGKALAIIDAAGWDFEKMSAEAKQLAYEHGEKIAWISLPRFALPPKFGLLIAEFFPNLQALNVAGSNFCNDDFSFVTNPEWLPHLKRLDVRATKITHSPRAIYARP